MMSRRSITTAGGFLAAVIVLAVLVSVVGVSELLEVLNRADGSLVGAVFCLTGLWLVSWGLALWMVLGSLGTVVPVLRAVLLYTSAAFANNITPFGQAGGEPVTALLLAESDDIAYERGLAAITGVDTANLVPSVGLALAGTGYLAVTTVLGQTLSTVAVGIGGISVLVLLGGIGLWRVRLRAAERISEAVTPIVRRLARVIPRVEPPGESAVSGRIHGFITGIEQIGAQPRRLAVTLVFSTVGWGCQMVALWVALLAVGVSVSPVIPVIVVPMGAIAGAAPLPGGVGGIETVLVILLVAAPIGASQATVLGAVVLFRGAVYWMPTLVGGTIAGIVAGQAASNRRNPG